MLAPLLRCQQRHTSKKAADLGVLPSPAQGAAQCWCTAQAIQDRDAFEHRSHLGISHGVSQRRTRGREASFADRCGFCIPHPRMHVLEPSTRYPRTGMSTLMGGMADCEQIIREDSCALQARPTRSQRDENELHACSLRFVLLGQVFAPSALLRHVSYCLMSIGPADHRRTAWTCTVGLSRAGLGGRADDGGILM